MRKLRIREALAFKQLNEGVRMSQDELAKKLYPTSSRTSRNLNLSKMIKGESKRIDINAVHVICEQTGVDANFLFGVKPMHNE